MSESSPISSEQLDFLLECLSEPACGLLLYCRVLNSGTDGFDLIDPEAARRAEALSYLGLFEHRVHTSNIGDIPIYGYVFTELGWRLTSRYVEKYRVST